MDKFSYYFFWTYCVLQILGFCAALSIVGKKANPKVMFDIYTRLITCVLIFIACWNMKI